MNWLPRFESLRVKIYEDDSYYDPEMQGLPYSVFILR